MRLELFEWQRADRLSAICCLVLSKYVSSAADPEYLAMCEFLVGGGRNFMRRYRLSVVVGFVVL